MKQWKYHNSSLEYDIYIFLIFILFFAGVLLKGLTKRNLMDLNMSTHCLCQLKTKSNQRIHVQRNLKIVHFIAFIQYDRYINAAILIHTILQKNIFLHFFVCYRHLIFKPEFAMWLTSLKNSVPICFSQKWNHFFFWNRRYSFLSFGWAPTV